MLNNKGENREGIVADLKVFAADILMLVSVETSDGKKEYSAKEKQPVFCALQTRKLPITMP